MSAKKFSDKSTAIDVIKGHDLSGYEIIVTGGASGIGVETVRALAKAGARVVIGARDVKRAQEVANEIKNSVGSNKIEVERLDLASLKSVHEFAKNYLAKNRPLHILVNNAGVMACPLTYTEDGFEMQIGTNHFGHFALTLDLIPALKEGAKQRGKNSRVVNVSSIAHIYSDVDLNDINYKNRPYDQWQSYGQSKTANVLFAVALNKRYASQGINSNALMPGVIMTNLQRNMSDEEKKKFGIIDADGKPSQTGLLKSIEQGAATTIWACVASELEGKGGLYLEDCQISKEKSQADLMTELGNGKYMPTGVTPYARDEKTADKLWELSEKALRPKSSK